MEGTGFVAVWVELEHVRFRIVDSHRAPLLNGHPVQIGREFEPTLPFKLVARDLGPPPPNTFSPHTVVCVRSD
jgi:hypothetical protein